MNSKSILLIAGGGTLGTYVGQELIKHGHLVDVICLEDKISDNERLKFFKEYATIENLKKRFGEKYYDGIVNFLHYPNAEAYRPYHELLSANTDHLIFLSSYRVYADKQHPLTETAPFLFDTVQDDGFFATETYALGKTKCEHYLNDLVKSGVKPNWTVVRPVISFSNIRFDIVCNTGHMVLDAAKEGKKLYVPKASRNLCAGLDWSGNSGKLIANLLFHPNALGEAYTVSTGQNLTWGEIADIYTEALGVEFKWIDSETYAKQVTEQQGSDYIFKYDRLFNRDIDCSKIMKETGLKPSDFITVKDGILRELRSLNAIK